MRAKQQIRDLNEKPPHLIEHALLVNTLNKEIESQQKLIEKLRGSGTNTIPESPDSQIDWRLKLLNASHSSSPPRLAPNYISPKDLSYEIEELQKAFAKINGNTDQSV